MRSTTPLFALVALAFCELAFASPTPTDAERATGQEVTGKGSPCGGSEKVQPGESKTNGDGATVSNAGNSGGNASIDPASGCGDGNSETTVTTKTGFKGSISGLDANDKVTLSSSNTVTITGKGGHVTIAGGSTVTCVNEAGGGNMTVTLPSGGTATVAPGSTVTFS